MLSVEAVEKRLENNPVRLCRRRESFWIQTGGVRAAGVRSRLLRTPSLLWTGFTSYALSRFPKVC
jgi:hypothetical protein